MKKSVIALVAVATLGLAACNSATPEANNYADLNATENAADLDVNASAVDAANSSLDSVGNTLEDAGNAVVNTAEDASNVVENATDGN